MGELDDIVNPLTPPRRKSAHTPLVGTPRPNSPFEGTTFTCQSWPCRQSGGSRLRSACRLPHGRTSASSAKTRTAEAEARVHVPDLIQKQRAAIGCPETSLARRSPGKRTPGVAEKLCFRQRLRNRSTVDRHKRSAAALAQLMNRAGHQLLAASRLSAQQNRDTIFHRRTRTHQQPFITKEIPTRLGIWLRLRPAHSEPCRGYCRRSTSPSSTRCQSSDFVAAADLLLKFRSC